MDYEKRVVIAGVILAFVVGIRHANSLFLSVAYVTATVPIFLFVGEMAALLFDKNKRAGYAISFILLLAAIGWAAFGPVKDSVGGSTACIQVDRWGSERCE